MAMGGKGFSVAFDPLDGSSIVDTNFSVGTIFGVWPGDKLVGITGREQVRKQPERANVHRPCGVPSHTLRCIRLGYGENMCLLWWRFDGLLVVAAKD